MQLRGAIAVVTGASRGIGRATALALAAKGANVALGARSAEDLTHVAEEAGRLGVESLVVPVDVSDQGSAEGLVRAATGRWGRVDVVVANAGQYLRQPALELTVEEVRRSLEVNFYGSLYPILAALPQMAERGSGAIVVVGSLDGRRGLPGDGPYVIAKFALSGLVQVLRQELRSLGIQVNGVFPGRVDTDFVTDLHEPRISKKISAERVGRVIVRAVERNRAEVVIPRFNRLLLYADLISPRLTDWAVGRLRLSGQWSESGRADTSGR
ncbi:MAG: SDR family NAD(P)-dependent oxidoreductase [Gaiellaceae bacterium]